MKALDLISLTSILSGIFIIINKNPIVLVLFLIELFLSIASYLLVLDLNFIGLLYLLIYIKAILILFLFILILINVRISKLLSNTSNSISLALLIDVSFIYSIYKVLPLNSSSFNLNNIFKDFIFIIFSLNKSFNPTSNNSKLIFITSKIWDDSLIEIIYIISIGNIIYISYSI